MAIPTSAISKKKLFPTKENNQDDKDKLRKIKLKSIIKRQQGLLKNKRSSLCKLRSNLKTISYKLNTSNMINFLKYQSPSSRTLVTMQILHSVKSRQQWTLNEKKFALSLFYKSPTTYSFLKSKLQVILPGVSTIKRWIGTSKFLPGYNSNLFNQIKLKTETLTANEKYCIVAFDKMKIKFFLEHSKPLDLVEGFED